VSRRHPVKSSEEVQYFIRNQNYEKRFIVEILEIEDVSSKKQRLISYKNFFYSSKLQTKDNITFISS
jgi:hypothetical protein